MSASDLRVAGASGRIVVSLFRASSPQASRETALVGVTGTGDRASVAEGLRRGGYVLHGQGPAAVASVLLDLTPDLLPAGRLPDWHMTSHELVERVRTALQGALHPDVWERLRARQRQGHRVAEVGLLTADEVESIWRAGGAVVRVLRDPAGSAADSGSADSGGADSSSADGGSANGGASDDDSTDGNSTDSDCAESEEIGEEAKEEDPCCRLWEHRPPEYTLHHGDKPADILSLVKRRLLPALRGRR